MRRFVSRSVSVSLAAVVVAGAMSSGCRSGSPTASSGRAATAVRQSGNVVSVGEPMKAKASPVTVAQVMAAPEAYAGKTVRIAGDVRDVCSKKGCWVRLADAGAPAGAESLFVKFTCPEEKDGRIMPLASKGRPAVVEGELVVREISEDEARHYAEDAGKPASEVARIVGPQKLVTLKSPSASVTLAGQ